MFALLTFVEQDLRWFGEDLDPDRLRPEVAAAGIEQLARIERLAAGQRLRLARRIDSSVTGGDGSERDRAAWLARTTGQTHTAATQELTTAEQVAGLAATERSLTAGELSPTQAREVASAAAADPGAEAELLDTARQASVAELRRKAKKVRAAATDDRDKRDRAHRDRSLSSGTDDETGEGFLHVKGPADLVGAMLSLLEPWIQARFDKARRDGRREGRGAYAFDALLDALRYADAARRGGRLTTDGTGEDVPKGPAARILARVDVAALQRGHAIAGETCEIAGLGPVPIESLRRLLPDAVITVILNRGVDAWNITNLKRRSNAHQQAVLDWVGAECARLGCGATHNLQIDHRIDWAHTHVTQLGQLDVLCAGDHRLKTVHGWALVAGEGKRPMVPPDHPDHPANAPPPSSTSIDSDLTPHEPAGRAHPAAAHGAHPGHIPDTDEPTPHEPAGSAHPTASRGAHPGHIPDTDEQAPEERGAGAHTAASRGAHPGHLPDTDEQAPHEPAGRAHPAAARGVHPGHTPDTDEQAPEERGAGAHTAASRGAHPGHIPDTDEPTPEEPTAEARTAAAPPGPDAPRGARPGAGALEPSTAPAAGATTRPTVSPDPTKELAPV